MFTNERLFTIQVFTITRVHCISKFLIVKDCDFLWVEVEFLKKTLESLTLFLLAIVT
jgi:hypothetical protein